LACGLAGAAFSYGCRVDLEDAADGDTPRRNRRHSIGLKSGLLTRIEE
jgi:hypothetical protein